MIRLLGVAALGVAVACGGTKPSASSGDEQSGGPASSAPESSEESLPSPAPVVQADAGGTAEAALDAAPSRRAHPRKSELPPRESTPADAARDVAADVPAPVDPTGEWPFYRWDRAVAFTYNLHKPGPGALRVYSQTTGWVEGRREGPALEKRQAKAALRLLGMTQGQLLVSKCAYPRHAIVFYQGETPVGSINVCFECGDIMLWPAYSKEAGWEDKKYKRMGKLMKAYDRAFPKWKRLFERDLGLATDWQKLGGASVK